MLAFGIYDRLNLLDGLLYVKTASTVPNGGKFAGAKGFQDLSLALKAENIKHTAWHYKYAYNRPSPGQLDNSITVAYPDNDLPAYPADGAD